MSDATVHKIKELAKELVFHYGYNQHKLYKEITSYLAMHSTRQKNVVYNTVHGGFSYSDQFCKFADVDEGYGERENRLAEIIKFGKHVAKMHPHIFRMCVTYEICGLRQQVNVCRDIERLESCKKNLVSNLTVIQDVMKVGVYNGTLILGENELQTKVMGFEFVEGTEKLYEDCKNIYAHDSLCRLEELVDARIAKLCVKLDEMLVGANLDMLGTLKRKFFEEEQNDKLHQYQRHKWTSSEKKKLTFLDAISYYGEKHFAVWMCQSSYNAHAMRYLLMCPEAITTDSDCGDEIPEQVYIDLGLVAASGEYCALGIAYVPSELSYSILEYDGLESILVI